MEKNDIKYYFGYFMWQGRVGGALWSSDTVASPGTYWQTEITEAEFQGAIQPMLDRYPEPKPPD